MKKISILILIVMFLEIFSFVFTISISKAYSSDEATQKINESVAYAMSLLDDNMTDYEKAVVLAQYTQEGNLYNYATHDQTAEGILVDHVAVCAGYADTYQLLMNTAGLVTENLISAKAVHEWNISLLNGKWTYSDTTKNMTRSRHQSTDSKLFKSQLDFDFIKYNGITYQGSTAPQEAIEKGESQYFEDAYMTNHDSDLPYMNAVTINGQNSYCSTVYFDKNYKYYLGRADNNFYTKNIYKENRITGEKEILVRHSYDYGGTDTNIVKDGDYIYYVGEDFESIYQIKTDGTDNKKVYDITGTGRQIAGIYVSDGYMYYATLEKETSRKYEYVQYKKLQNAVTTGSYTLNNNKQKYALEYIKSSKGITISKCVGINGTEPTGEIYIPETIEGMPVIGIGIEAFEDTNLTGILTIPENVEYISDSAFQNTKIEGIKFNDKLKYIGISAFSECSEITGTLALPDSIVKIGEQSFDDCSKITAIDLGDGIKRIGNSAFSGDHNITVVEVPESVEYLDGNSFNYMLGLKAAILPKNLKIYSADTFTNCGNLTDVWIKSENIEVMTGNDKVNLYIPVGTQTSKYADENGIKYISDSELNIDKVQIRINNITTKEENITNIELQPNEKVTLEADITPAIWCTEPITWKSSNTNIAEVTQNGEVVAKSDGNTIITAIIAGKSKSIDVKVENLKTVQFDKTNMTLNKGQTAMLKITSGADESSDIVWKVKSMANPSKEYDINNLAIMRYLTVATTDDKREVTVRAVDIEDDNNQYQIIAYVNGKNYGTCDISIQVPIESALIVPASQGISIMFNGEEARTEIDYNNAQTKNFSLKLSFEPNNTTEEIPEVEWTVEDPNIIQNNGNGAFTILRGGTTTITAKAGKFEEKLKVMVTGDTENILYGDVNLDGEVTATDGFLAYDYFVNEGEISDDVFIRADVTKDGEITATDGFLIYDAFVNEKIL